MKKLAALLVGGTLVAGATTVPLMPVTATQGIVEGNAALISSLQLQWDTPDGNLALGQYGLDETGKNYWGYFLASTTATTTIPAHFSKVPIATDMTGMTQIAYLGERGVDYYTAPDGSVTQQFITPVEYQAEATQTTTKSTTVFVPLVETPIASAITAPSVVAASDTGTLTGTASAHTSDSFAVTVASSGTNEVFVSVSDDHLWTSATIGGQAMTVKTSSPATCQNASIAYKLVPLTGSQTYTINFASQTWAERTRGVTLQDVSAFDQFITLGASATTSITEQMTTAQANEMVMAHLVVGGTAATDLWGATDIFLAQAWDAQVSWSYKTNPAAGNISAKYGNLSTQCPQLNMFAFQGVAAAAGGTVVPMQFQEAWW